MYGRYDAATDTWANSPHFPRTNSGQALWTGSLMIIGNGLLTTTSQGPPAPLERYDPTLDTWTTASSIGAPIGSNPGAGPPVWTGQYVITMAKRYDPISDVWTPVSAVGAPPSLVPATRMVAVWTGTRMIVWRPGNGGLYDPATDTWTPMSNTDAPPSFPVEDYEGVWTGSRLIVWGAYDGLNTWGGRYDPATDTWSLVPFLNAPLPGSTSEWSGPAGGWSCGEASTGRARFLNPKAARWRNTSPTPEAATIRTPMSGHPSQG